MVMRATGLLELGNLNHLAESGHFQTPSGQHISCNGAHPDIPTQCPAASRRAGRGNFLATYLVQEQWGAGARCLPERWPPVDCPPSRASI
jgi:hypothetical protein